MQKNVSFFVASVTLYNYIDNHLDIQEVVSVCPESGVMPLHLSGGTVSTKLIQVEFSPRYVHRLCVRTSCASLINSPGFPQQIRIHEKCGLLVNISYCVFFVCLDVSISTEEECI